MNARVIPRTIELADIDTRLAVGVREHEPIPQPILVSMTIGALARGDDETAFSCRDVYSHEEAKFLQLQS